MKNKKSIKPRAQTWGKNGILIGCALFGAAVIMAGTGIGVGYAIWNRTPDVTPSDTPSEITYKTTPDHTQIFDGKGHMVHFVFSMSKAFKYKICVHFTLDDSLEQELMKNNGEGVIQFCNPDGSPLYDCEVYADGEMSYFMNPGQTTLDVYIMQYLDNPETPLQDSEPMMEVPFALNFYYLPGGDYGPEVPFENDNNDCSIYMLNNRPANVTADNITNWNIVFGTVFSGVQTMTIDAFHTYLNTPIISNNLPTVDTGKADLSGIQSMSEVMQELQKFDNATSMCAMIIADYVLSILKSSPMYHDRDYWEDLTLKFFHVNRVQGAGTGGDTSYFGITFFCDGCNETVYQENNKAYFIASDTNYNATDDNKLFKITWDTRIYGEKAKHDHESTLEGLKLTTGGYKDPTDINQINLRKVISWIYGGVVQTNKWPVWWNIA